MKKEMYMQPQAETIEVKSEGAICHSISSIEWFFFLEGDEENNGKLGWGGEL